MLRPLVAALLALAPAAAPAAPAVGPAPFATAAQTDDPAAAFARGRADVEALMRGRRWKEAYERYQELLAEHERADYVIAQVAEIEAELKRCAFWMTHDEPKLEDLLDARLVRWDPYRGGVTLHFDRDHLGDLVQHRFTDGVVYELPVEWDGTWNATFEGPAAVLAADQIYVLVDDDLGYVVTIGHLGVGAKSYTQHELSRIVDGRVTPIEEARPKPLADGELVTARVSVTRERIELTVADEPVFDFQRDDGGGFGRVALSWRQDGGGGDFGTLDVDGSAETGWFDGRIDAAIQAARDAFDASWDASEHMPAWLASAEGRATGDDAPPLGPFPVPEAFDLASADHPRTAEHVEHVEHLLETRELAAALRYLNELGPDDVEPTVRAFLACVTLICAERPREAFEAGKGLWSEQPGSLTAG